MAWFKKRPKRVAFLDSSENGVTENRLKGPLNGRLTCLHNVSQWLASRGHAVEVVGRHPRFTTDRGVSWVPEFSGEYDTIVFVRGLGDAAPGVTAKKRMLWVRDLPHSGFCPQTEKLANVQVVALSSYGAGIWKAFHPQIRDIRIIPNGVDKEVFRPGGDANRKRFIFASNPNRGLDRLPLIFETLRMVDPEVEMVAFSDRETLHPGESGDYADAYDKCIKAGIAVRRPVSPKTLAQFFRSSCALVMPTDYPEICSNVVLQALACGLPIITTGNLGATCEWVNHRHNGLLTEYQKHDYQIFDLEMARLCKDVLQSEKLWRSLRIGARETPVWSWTDVARAWENLI